MDLFKDFGADEILGQVTPTGLFPTMSIRLSGDGWSIYDNGLNNAGLFSDHLEYLGLTYPDIEIANCRATLVGMEHLPPSTSRSKIPWSTASKRLLTQLQIADSILF